MVTFAILPALISRRMTFRGLTACACRRPGYRHLMDPEVDERVALKRWLHHRLTEDNRAKEEWHRFLESTWAHLLATPVRALIDADTAKAAADQLMDTELIPEISGTITAAVVPRIMAELRADDQPLGRFLPQEAQAKLKEAIARPGLVHPDWVRAAFRGDAAEAVLNDALYRALRDFSTLLPRVLLRLPPMGRFAALRGAGALAEKTIKDLETRIEPEIRSFLSDNTGRMLARAAEFAVSRLDDPASMEFRANFVGFVLAQSPGRFLEAVDDELFADIGTIVELTVRHAPTMPEIREDVHAWIDRLMKYAGDKTLGEALHMIGTEARFPFGALAEATWPALTTILHSLPARIWMDTLLDELMEEYDRIRRAKLEPSP